MEIALKGSGVDTNNHPPSIRKQSQSLSSPSIDTNARTGLLACKWAHVSFTNPLSTCPLKISLTYPVMAFTATACSDMILSIRSREIKSAVNLKVNLYFVVDVTDMSNGKRELLQSINPRTDRLRVCFFDINQARGLWSMITWNLLTSKQVHHFFSAHKIARYTFSLMK